MVNFIALLLIALAVLAIMLVLPLIYRRTRRFNPISAAIELAGLLEPQWGTLMSEARRTGLVNLVATSTKPGTTPTVTVPGVPFTASAHEHQERAFTVTKLITAATQQLDPINVPSFGYLRHIFLDVSSTGGAGAATGKEDYPWNLLQSVTLLDVNGAPIVGPMDGYALLWANIIGGYALQSDPRKLPGFSNNVDNPFFQIRIPVEIAHYNGLGSIANQNAAAPYQLLITLNSSTGAWSSVPATTLPTVTIKGTIECWTLPAATDSNGRPQQQLPPAHGTGQFWSSRNVNVAVSGDNTVPILRVGNLIRNLVFICRTTAPARSDTVFPDPIIVNMDGRQMTQESQTYRIQREFEQLENSTRDTGVFIYSFDTSLQGRAGDGPPNMWIPTTEATRLEVTGNWAAAGSVQVLVNDIQPIEVNPADRYVESNATTPTPTGLPQSAAAAG